MKLAFTVDSYDQEKILLVCRTADHPGGSYDFESQMVIGVYSYPDPVGSVVTECGYDVGYSALIFYLYRHRSWKMMTTKRTMNDVVVFVQEICSFPAAV